jgi:alpha-L-fucosidase
MSGIAAMARSHQPGLIVVDRSVPGEFENIPDPRTAGAGTPMDDPWESCITMGNSWSYVPHDHYKSATELVQLLVKIVSRGGNFLLNIGPSPEGDWDDTAYARLKDIGAWMTINGEGIYGSRPIRPYASGNVYLTQSKDSLQSMPFIFSEGSDVILPAQVTIDRFTPRPGSKISILGVKGKIKWHEDGKKMVIEIPAALQHKVGQHAVVF